MTFRFWRKKPMSIQDRVYHREYEYRPRVEQLKIGMRLNKAQCDKHQAAIAAIAQYSPSIIDGDLLSLNYSLACEYIGNVEQGLRAVLSILKDRNVVRSVSLDELRYGESLIVEVLDHIREIQRCSAIGAKAPGS